MQIFLKTVSGSTITLEVESEYTYDSVVKILTKELDEMNMPLITTNPRIIFTIGDGVELKEGQTLNDINVQKEQEGFFYERIYYDEDGSLLDETKLLDRARFNFSDGAPDKIPLISLPSNPRERGPWVEKLNVKKKELWESLVLLKERRSIRAGPLPVNQSRQKIDPSLFRTELLRTLGGNKKRKNTYQCSKRKVTKRKVTKRKVSKRRSLRIRRT